MGEEADWQAINLQKQMNIIKGQSANQAWAKISEKVHVMDFKKKLDENLDDYEELYNKLLERNFKMILGRGISPSTPPIPEETHTAEEQQAASKGEPKLVEVGAAWKDKKNPEKQLNCKHNDSGTYKNVPMEDLEKTDDGYIYNNDQGKLILKEIKVRPNPKMPHYKIFKEEE